MKFVPHIDRTPVQLPAGTRVLIVEDQPLVALAASDMVANLGGAVAFSAATVAEALDAIAPGRFTVALLDLDLDGCPSDPVARALSQAHTPFVITTGHIRTIAGFEYAPVLMKPYLTSQLGRALLGLLPAAQTA